VLLDLILVGRFASLPRQRSPAWTRQLLFAAQAAKTFDNPKSIQKGFQHRHNLEARASPSLPVLRDDPKGIGPDVSSGLILEQRSVQS
jgi:hypothetical protein